MITSLLYDTDLSRVRLVAEDDIDSPGAKVRIERSTDQVRWATVRGGEEVPSLNDTFSLDDYEFAADVPNYYRLVDVTDPVNSTYVETLGRGSGSVLDDFNRTEANTWGTAPTGQPWTNAGGVAADYSMTGTKARHSHSSMGVDRANRLDTISIGDIDVVIRGITCSVAPTGANVEMGFRSHVDFVNNSFNEFRLF